MAETIQEAFLILSQRGGFTFEALARWQLDGTLPNQPMALSRKIAIGAMASTISVSTLGIGLEAVHAQSNGTPSITVETSNSAVSATEAASLRGKVDISGVINAVPLPQKLELAVPPRYNFSRPTNKVDISSVVNAQNNIKVAPAAPQNITAQPADSTPAEIITEQPIITSVAVAGPLGGSLVGDSIARMAGDMIPAKGAAYNLAISVFAKGGMPLLNPVCEPPVNEAECAKTLDGIRMQEQHAVEMADDEFVVFELGRNKQDRSRLTGDRYLEALERNLQLGDQITGADGVPARKFVLNVASGPGDKPAAAQAVAERATMLDENAERLGVTIVRWRELAGEHPEWFLGDGVHLNSLGSEAMADLIAKTVNEEMLKAPEAPVAQTIIAEPAVVEPITAVPVNVEPIFKEKLSLPEPEMLFSTKVDISQAYIALMQGEQAGEVPTLIIDTSPFAPVKPSKDKKTTVQPINLDVTGIAPPAASQRVLLDELAPEQPAKELTAKTQIDPPDAVIPPEAAPEPALEPAPAPQPVPAMSAEQLAEQLGITAIDNLIVEQAIAGGDIELAGVADFYINRPDLAPIVQGVMSTPLPLATVLDSYIFNSNNCLSERRVYPEQAAAIKAWTVWYNWLVNNDERFIGLRPSIPKVDDTMSTPHGEHNPEQPAVDINTMYLDSSPGADEGPAFVPGGNPDLEEEMVRFSERLRYNGNILTHYDIFGSPEVEERVRDLIRPAEKNKQFDLIRPGHEKHIHMALFRYSEKMAETSGGEITDEASYRAPCPDGAPLTSLEELEDFTSTWAQQLTDAANPQPPAEVVPPVDVTPPEVVVPVPDPKQEVAPEARKGKVDISGLVTVVNTDIVKIDSQAPDRFIKKSDGKTPPVKVEPVAEPAPEVVTPPAQEPNIDGGSESDNKTEESTVTGLEFPAFDDKEAIAANITNYIKGDKPSSPWLTIDGIGENIGEYLVNEAEVRNINPMFIVSSGKQENQFGTDGDAPKFNNFFGMKGGSSKSYLKFASPQEGIQAFMDAIANNIYGDGAGGRYRAAKNMYEYFSIHQSGVIAYPGEPLDPNDNSGPGGKPDGNTMEGYDNSMDVYTSWTRSDHPNDKYDGTLYNPLNYYRTSIKVINAVTGLELSTEDPQRST